jgi:hypothetical protein
MSVTHDQILALLVLKDGELFALKAALAAAERDRDAARMERDNLAARIGEPDVDTDVFDPVVG